MLHLVLKWLIGDAANELEGLRFVFHVPFSQGVAVVLLVLVGLAVVLFFWPKLARLRPALRALLIALRAAAAVLILFLLLDPCVTGKRLRHTERAVLLLFDDSKSMQVAGPDGQTRGQRLLERYEAAAAELEKKLRDKCQLILCRFGESLERIQSPRDLRFEQNESDLVGAAAAALADFEGANVAAVALLSDGVQQTSGRPPDWNALDRFRVPVFGIGVGADSQWRDLEVGPLAVQRPDFDGNPVVIKAPILASGLAGQEAVVEALVDGTAVQTNHLKIAGDSPEMEARLEFVPAKKGWIELEVRARLAADAAGKAAAPGDLVPQNNARRVLIDNRDKTFRILYLCGRPNWENKFIRRAMEEDKQLKLISLVRISGPEKTFKYRGDRSNLANPIFEGTDLAKDMPRYDEAVFLRFGAEKAELDKGYPTRAEDLFPYHLVIWGEIEAAFFSQAQLELTREYVRKRGGALLLLGGRDSFSEGGFAGTPLESLLPARLPASARPGDAGGLDRDRPFEARPTLEGLLSGVWSLDPASDENRRLWGQMPPLYGINPFALVRPGATIQANAVAGDAEKEGRPLFAVQRYGEGRSAVLATDSTWQWRLGADENDRKHERLWRQIVRSLVRQTPDSIRLRNKQDVYVTGNLAPLEFAVRDAVFDQRESLNVTVTAAAPSGRQMPLPVEESIQEAGLYSCEYTPQEPGMHKLSLAALDDQGKTIGSLEQAVLAEPDQREFHQPQYNPSFLRDVARRTGGAFLPIEDIARLPDRISWLPSEQAEEARVHLWRLPVFYAALAALMIVEWYLRRKKGYR